VGGGGGGGGGGTALSDTEGMVHCLRGVFSGSGGGSIAEKALKDPGTLLKDPGVLQKEPGFLQKEPGAL